jgi:hypothetical protein
MVPRASNIGSDRSHFKACGALIRDTPFESRDQAGAHLEGPSLARDDFTLDWPVTDYVTAS